MAEINHASKIRYLGMLGRVARYAFLLEKVAELCLSNNAKWLSKSTNQKFAGTYGTSHNSASLYTSSRWLKGQDLDSYRSRFCQHAWHSGTRHMTPDASLSTSTRSSQRSHSQAQWHNAGVGFLTTVVDHEGRNTRHSGAMRVLALLIPCQSWGQAHTAGTLV